MSRKIFCIRCDSQFKGSDDEFNILRSKLENQYGYMGGFNKLYRNIDIVDEHGKTIKTIESAWSKTHLCLSCYELLLKNFIKFISEPKEDQNEIPTENMDEAGKA